MQIDFHYYLIYGLAKEAAYTDADAEVLAYASQYVDNNKERQYVVSDEFGRFYVDFPKRIEDATEITFPIITQGEDFTCFDLHVQRYAYCPFHFIPGDNKASINGHTNPLCTDEGCTRSTALVNAAKSQNDLYKLGIALHTYADTWSHTRFSAFHEDWNRVYHNIVKNIPPNIGQAEVLTMPDEISTTWRDERINEDIKNRDRAIQAMEAIFGLINKGSASWSGVKGACEQFVGATDSNSRIKQIRNKYSIQFEYDEDKWINEALSFIRNTGNILDATTIPGAPLPRPGFVNITLKDGNAHWIRFQHAAKTQLSWVLDSAKFI
ncbi:MAG TPA: DUF6765 family protein [Nitrospirota bacterium]|nr:DUF6765 family protein [Nitrospirota bacterium]